MLTMESKPSLSTSSAHLPSMPLESFALMEVMISDEHDLAITFIEFDSDSRAYEEMNNNGLAIPQFWDIASVRFKPSTGKSVRSMLKSFN